jgi:MFS family permease
MTTNDPMLPSQSPEPPQLPVKPDTEKHDPYAALRLPNYRRYFIGNAFSVVGTQMAGATIAWELYELTRSKMVLGLVGLVQIIPIVALALPAGHIIDRTNRKKLILLMTGIVTLMFAAMGFSSRFAEMMPGQNLVASVNGALRWLSQDVFGEGKVSFTHPHVPILLSLLFLSGMLRAVNQPAKQSIMPMLVPPKHFPNAVTWNSSLFEITNMIGPATAGLLIWFFHRQNTDVQSNWGCAWIYWLNALFQLVQLINFSMIELRPSQRSREPLTLKSLLAGVHFVTSNKIVFGAITLDLFAVLLGGATALLPVFAEMLGVGALGFGLMRAAPSVGALAMALILAHRPPMEHAGRNLLWSVIGFGIATIVFGLSRNFVISLIALMFTGVFDNMSVVVRHTLVQLLTPDSLRGRVNAVNSVFISCSNELGAARAGTTAAMLGPMTAVAGGGLGTILVVVLVAMLFPQVRRVKRLADQVAHEPHTTPADAPAKAKSV